MSQQEQNDPTLRTNSAPHKETDGGGDFLASTTWSSESLQSRLYSDTSTAKLGGAGVGGANQSRTGGRSSASLLGGQTLKKTARGEGRVLNSRMMGSQSTPAMRTLSSGKVLERKSAKKTQSIVSKNSRQLFSKSVLPPPSDASLLRDFSAAGSDLHTEIDPALPSSSSVSNNEGEEGDAKVVPRTFLESLCLSSKHQHELFHVPHTFFYLSKANVNTRAYDLQLIAQEAIDKNQYYTISKEGLTLHRGSDSEFTSLSQWEREYSLFHQISVIPFFRQYRRWKVSTISFFSFLLFHYICIY
jgi:hypothetical protein